MLAIVFKNVGIDEEGYADYEVKVIVSDPVVEGNVKTLWTGKVESHLRKKGWLALLRQFAKEMQEVTMVGGI